MDIGNAIHSDGWRGYDGLVDIGLDKNFKVNHGVKEFANGETGLSVSGVMLNGDWQSLMVCLRYLVHFCAEINTLKSTHL